MNIKTVTVIGATGTMGANVAGIFASFGNAKVFMVGRDIEKVKKTIPKTVKSVRADCIAARLIAADFTMLPDCVRQSDFVFESCAEDFSIKKQVAEIVSKNLKNNAISCTGTSGLSITELAKCYPESSRGMFFGVHMFNPPYNMSLCELTSTIYSNEKIKEELKEYLCNTLLRTVVEVKDTPAFLGNRIGFYFINEALIYAERYKDNGGIDYIDSILGSFTGRSMPPLVTSDFVGLDVHKAIVDNIYNNSSDSANDSFVFPKFTQKLVSEGKLGRKAGCGLYQTIKYDNGLKRHTVYDIVTDTYRDTIKYVFPFAEEMKKAIHEGEYQKAFEYLVENHSQEAEICKHFLINYIAYSLLTAKQVGFTLQASDDVMATGFNWCPPLSLLQLFTEVTDVHRLFNTYVSKEMINEGKLSDILSKQIPTYYDYRQYLKVGR